MSDDDEWDHELFDTARPDVLNLCEMQLGVATGLDMATSDVRSRALIRMHGHVVNGEGESETTYLVSFNELRKLGALLTTYSDAYDRGEIKP